MAGNELNSNNSSTKIEKEEESSNKLISNCPFEYDPSLGSETAEWKLFPPASEIERLYYYPALYKTKLLSLEEIDEAFTAYEAEKSERQGIQEKNNIENKPVARRPYTLRRKKVV